MKYLITGGCGFVGSNLAESFLDYKSWINGPATGTSNWVEEELIVLDNFSTGYLRNKKYLEDLCPDTNWEKGRPKLSFMQLDIREDLTKYEDLMEVDVIFHIGALARIQPSFNRPALTLDVNSQGTVSVLELARANGAKVVYAGSSSFYFDPYANPYAYSKWIGEEHCKMYAQVYGVDVGIARFFNVYGPRMVENGSNAAVLGIFQRQKKEGKPLTITGDGAQKRDFTNVKDIANGLKAIAFSNKKWKGEVFNLGRSSNHSINEVAQMFKPDGIEYIPARPGEARDTLADISFSKEQLGWEPKCNLEDYVAEFLKSIGA